MILDKDRFKRISPFGIIIASCGVNLMIMHYYILCSCHMDAILDVTSFIDNFLGISFDVIFLFFVLILITWKRIKLSLYILFTITWLWSIFNIIYSRFFHHYLSFSAIGQGGSLFDGVVIRSISDKVYIWDLLYFFFYMLIISIIWKINIKNTSHVKHLLVFFCFFALMDIVGHVFCCLINPKLRYVHYFTHRIYANHIDMSLNSSQPIYANFSRGSIRSIGLEILTDLRGNLKLDASQVEVINTMIDSSQKMHYHLNDVKRPSNLIFILVESLMSFTSEMKVGDNEVTPFLNSLKRDPSVYYNGKMVNNVTIGESSDGQYIYMTGLLPLRSMVTVSKAKRASLPGLPKILGVDSRMIIPTVSSMWNQDEMCRQYGFKDLYTSNDFEGGKYACLTDEQVFQLAIQKDKVSPQPFFSIILTISMHQPYTKQIDTSFPVKESSISMELANYLNVCHYTDRQIEKYFDYLKESGLFNNSLIVIAADHPVNSTCFGNDNNDIPLYIVNASGLPENMWQGKCNQLDVYTTLLDLFCNKCEWYGLGCSLVSPNYMNTVTPKTWAASEWILMSDFFSKDQ